LGVAFEVDGESANPYVPENLVAGRIVIGPGEEVQGARRQDFHVPNGGHPLRDRETQVFGTAIDFGAAALDHEGNAFQLANRDSRRIRSPSNRTINRIADSDASIS